MEKEQFWTHLEDCWNRGDMEEFWKLWDCNPEHLQEHFKNRDADLNHAYAQMYEQNEQWWSALYPKLTEILGEDWEKEHREGSL